MIDLLSLVVQVTKTEMVTPTFEGFLSDVSILVDEACLLKGSWKLHK